MRAFVLLAVAVPLVAQNYRATVGGAAPEQLPPEVREALQERSARVADPRGFLFCEVWLRSAPVAEGTTLPEALQAESAPQGALVGVIRYASPAADRQGRGFGPGLYTLRYAQGDSVLMVKADDDPNLEPPAFDQLEARSRKVSRKDAPAALRLAPGTTGPTPRLRITRDGEWILRLAAGQASVDLLIVGVAK